MQVQVQQWKILTLKVLVNETPAGQLDKRDTFVALGEDW